MTAARDSVLLKVSAFPGGMFTSVPVSEYVPGATRISSPLAAASMAGWMAVAAMAQLVYGAAGAAFDTFT